MRNCICDYGTCIEKGKIVWNNNQGSFIHIRIDGCVIKNNLTNACDCIIIFLPFNNDKLITFIVELKDSYGYSLDKIKCQLQICIDKILAESIIIQTKSLIIPILYANRHISNAKRIFHSYFIKIRGKKQNIIYLKYGENILNSLK